MKYSISIAIVAMLLAASFVGIAFVDDEADAASNPISIVAIEGSDNEISIVDGKIVGTLKGTGSYTFTLMIGDVSGKNIYYTVPCACPVVTFDKEITVTAGGTALASGDKVDIGTEIALSAEVEEGKVAKFYVNGATEALEADKLTVKEDVKITVKAVNAPEDDTAVTEPEADGGDDQSSAAVNGVHTVDVVKSTDGKITFTGTKAQIEAQIKAFRFVVTSSEIDLKTQTGAEIAFDNLYKDMGQTMGFDLKYSEDIIEIRYAVGDLVYVKSAMKGSAYTLVTLEDLNAPTPDRQKFVGWKDTKAGNTYPAGSAVVFDGETTLSAVFEALPEAVITFVDGTSTLKSINVSDLSEKTVPSVEKTGYTFDGWFMGDVKVDPLTYTFEESVTLVAQWTPINCYVTFVAGDFVKTVPVLYGDRVQAPALPDGFEKWNFDFSVVITDDLTITAVEKAPEKPTGLADPTVKMAMVIVGLFVCVLLAVIILKREDIRAGMVRKLSKAEDVKEDKKE